MNNRYLFNKVYDELVSDIGREFGIARSENFDLDGFNINESEILIYITKYDYFSIMFNEYCIIMKKDDILYKFDYMNFNYDDILGIIKKYV